MVRFSQAKRVAIWAGAVGTLLLLLPIGAVGAGQENQPQLSGPPLSIKLAGDSESSKLVRERRIIGRALKKASDEFNVPLAILQGIAFVQSRWTQIIPQEPSDVDCPGCGARIHDIPLYGVMGLRDDEHFGHSLVEAASLISETPERLKTDPIANIRGGAALLAALANEERNAGKVVDQRLETWKDVVERYSGIRSPDLAELFALDVFRVIREGYHQFAIDIDAHPDVDMSIFSEKALEQGGLKKTTLIASR